MAKAVVKIDQIGSGPAANLIEVGYTVTTDTGLTIQGTTELDFGQSIASNIANMRASAVAACQAFNGGTGPVITTANCILLNSPV